jgi:hypothetical protein
MSLPIHPLTRLGFMESLPVYYDKAQNMFELSGCSDTNVSAFGSGQYSNAHLIIGR